MNRRVRLYAGLLVATTVLLLAFTYATAVAQHAVGVYTLGHARWVTLRIAAVTSLRRFARTADDRELVAFAAARGRLRLFEAGRRAVGHGRYDPAAAAAAFAAAGIPREDAELAATFGRLFRYIPQARRTLVVWQRSDSAAAGLDAVALELRGAHAAGDSAAVVAALARTAAIEQALQQQEAAFVAALEETSRVLPRLILALGTVLGAGLILLGTIAIVRVARAAERSRAAEREHFLRFQALMEALPDVVTWYDRGSRITYVNSAFEALTGLRRAGAIGMTHRELARHTRASAETVDQWEDAIRRTFAGETEVSILIGITDGERRPRWLQVRFAPQADTGPEVRTVVAVGRDITALRASENALRERDAQLRHAQKLEAVGRLAGGIAHEFNNILTAITANLELALLDLPEGGRTREDLQAALMAARRASGLTRQLLMFGRRDPLDVRPVDVGALAAELEPLLQRLSGDQIQVRTSTPPSPAIALADAGQLQQILFNLVTNARDAMPRGGTIRIEVETATVDEVQARHGMPSGEEAGVRQPGDAPPAWVTLTVRDTGAGMPAATVERVFEPFFTTKPAGMGTGLGLSVVNGIVTQLGGHVTIDSSVGAGTAVAIALPAPTEAAPAGAAADPVTTTAERRAAAAPRTAHGVVVLLVEDEPPVRAAARRMLAAAGYDVEEAANADEARRRFAERPADIVVTDYMMPGATGVELLGMLREVEPGLPAVLISGYTGGTLLETSAVGDRTAILQKPFSRAALLDAVRTMLDGA